LQCQERPLGLSGNARCDPSEEHGIDGVQGHVAIRGHRYARRAEGVRDRRHTQPRRGLPDGLTRYQTPQMIHQEDNRPHPLGRLQPRLSASRLRRLVAFRLHIEATARQPRHRPPALRVRLRGSDDGHPAQALHSPRRARWEWLGFGAALHPRHHCSRDRLTLSVQHASRHARRDVLDSDQSAVSKPFHD